MKSLAEYVHAFLPHYAFDVEQVTQDSSWLILHDVLSTRFIKEHVEVYGRGDGYEDCFKGSLRMAPFVLISDVHLAIAHQLLY